MELTELKNIQTGLVNYKKGIEDLRAYENIPQELIVSLSENLVAFKNSFDTVSAELERLQNENALSREQVEGTNQKSILLEKRLSEISKENEKLKSEKESVYKYQERIDELQSELNEANEKLKSYDTRVMGDEVVNSEIKLMFTEISEKMEKIKTNELRVSSDIERMITATQRTNENSKRAVDVLDKYNKVIMSAKKDVQTVLDSNEETKVLYEKGIKELQEVDEKMEVVKEEVSKCKKETVSNSEEIKEINKKVEKHDGVLSKLRGLFK